MKLMESKQTAMQDLREDLQESILKINNRLDFLDNITDENVRNLCKVMVDTTLKGIVRRIDDELLEMEKQQIIDAYDDADKNSFGNSYGQGKKYYTSTYGSKGSDENHAYCGIIDCKCITSSQTEISDEEIEERAERNINPFSFIDGAKWYREQLKKK